MKTNLIVLAACCLLTSACCDKDYYRLPETSDGKPLENPGSITVIPDVKPDNNGGNLILIDEKGNETVIIPGQPSDLEENTYTIVYTNTKEGIDLKGTTVYLPIAEDGQVTPPETFYGGVGSATVTKDEVIIQQVNTPPVTRQLKLDLTLTGLKTEDVTSVQARLYGIPSSVDLRKGFNPDDKIRSKNQMGRAEEGEEVSGAYVFIGDGNLSFYDEGRVTGTVNLLPLELGSTQILILTIVTSTETFTPQIDVTTALEGFNHPGKPVDVGEGTIEYVPADLGIEIKTDNADINGMEITITDWTPGFDIEDEPTLE